MGLAMGCDLRICSDDAMFGVPAARLGLGYGLKGVKKLVRRGGPSYTNDIFKSARKFTAAEAQRMGLVSQVVPVAEVEKDVNDYADSMGAERPAHGRGGEIRRASSG